jgi:hypothetical protein
MPSFARSVMGARILCRIATKPSQESKGTQSGKTNAVGVAFVFVVCFVDEVEDEDRSDIGLTSVLLFSFTCNELRNFD